MTIFFITFFIVDMMLATVYYKDQMDWLSGWIHHGFLSLFFAFMYSKKWTIAVMTVGSFEFPTFIMAVSNVFPELSSDWCFGISFFIVRIVFHVYLLYKWLNMEAPPLRLWPLCFGMLLLHFYWFAKWCKGQARRMKKARINDKMGRLDRPGKKHGNTKAIYRAR